MKALRVVVDPNLLVSQLIGKRSGNLLTEISSRGFQLVVNEELIGEFEEVARRTKFRKYLPIEVVNALMQLLRNDSLWIRDRLTIESICRDPDDDYLLALCKAAKAHVLLTGDKDMLVLKKYGRTRIMNARTFVDEFLKRGTA